MPLERDEGEYAYAGQLLLQGIPPYQIAYNMKLPGTYLVYAGIMSVFGQTPEGIHIGMLVFNVATIVLLYLLTRSMFDGIIAGRAAVIYAILSVSVCVLGMAAHATQFVTFFGLAGVFVLWQIRRVSDWRFAFVCGLLLGLAFLMKQHGVFLILFGGIYLVLRNLLSKEISRIGGIRDVAVYSFGAVIPFLLTCYWLWNAGVWRQFTYWTIEYGSQYIQTVPWKDGIGNAIWQTWLQIDAHFFLWLVAFLGTVAAVNQILPGQKTASPTKDTEENQQPTDEPRHQLQANWFLLGYLVFSIFCMVPGLLFRQHYYVVILPALSILSSLGCDFFALKSNRTVPTLWQRVHWILNDIGPRRRMVVRRNEEQIASKKEASPTKRIKNRDLSGTPLRARWYFPQLMFILAVLPSLLMNFGVFFLKAPKDLCRQIYTVNPFPESALIADYLREHTKPTDTIAVFGSEPQLFFLSQRRSATGYIYTYPLVEPHRLSHQMQEEMAQEIEKNSPAYFVDVGIWMSWLVRTTDNYIFDWKDKYVAENYSLVGLISITPTETFFLVNEGINSFRPKSNHSILIMKRNEKMKGEK